MKKIKTTEKRDALSKDTISFLEEAVDLTWKKIEQAEAAVALARLQYQKAVRDLKRAIRDNNGTNTQIG